MKILKEVNIEKKHKCKYCKSVFTYKQEDVDRVWFNNIKCPVCHQVMPVSIFDRKVRKEERN